MRLSFFIQDVEIFIFQDLIAFLNGLPTVASHQQETLLFLLEKCLLFTEVFLTFYIVFIILNAIFSFTFYQCIIIPYPVM